MLQAHLDKSAQGALPGAIEAVNTLESEQCRHIVRAHIYLSKLSHEVYVRRYHVPHKDAEGPR